MPLAIFSILVQEFLLYLRFWKTHSHLGEEGGKATAPSLWCWGNPSSGVLSLPLATDRDGASLRLGDYTSVQGAGSAWGASESPGSKGCSWEEAQLETMEGSHVLRQQVRRRNRGNWADRQTEGSKGTVFADHHAQEPQL